MQITKDFVHTRMSMHNIRECWCMRPVAYTKSLRLKAGCPRWGVFLRDPSSYLLGKNDRKFQSARSTNTNRTWTQHHPWAQNRSATGEVKHSEETSNNLNFPLNIFWPFFSIRVFLNFYFIYLFTYLKAYSRIQCVKTEQLKM